MQRFLYRVVLLICVLLSAPIQAQNVVSGSSSVFATNVVRVVVDDQSETQRRRALNRAFRQAVVKTAGDSAVFNAALWRRLERNAVALLKAYQYELNGDQTLYVATFDKEKLHQLLQQNELPIWDERRPDSLLWLTLYSPSSQDNYVVTDFDRDVEGSLFHRINDIAESRGVKIELPLMDIEDSQQVTAYDIWGRFLGPIQLASSRYNVDHIVTARIRRTERFDESSLRERLEALQQAAEFERLYEQEQQPNSPEIADRNDDALQEIELDNTPMGDDLALILDALVNSDASTQDDSEPQRDSLFNFEEFQALLSALKPYALDYSFSFAGRVLSGSLTGDSPEALVNNLVSLYIDTMSRQYSLKTTGQVGDRPLYEMTVANVNSLRAYTRVYELLDSLTMVAAVQLKSVSGSTAIFELELLSDQQRLIDALILDGQLLPGLDSFGNITDTQMFTWDSP